MVRAKFRCMSVTRRIKDAEANLKPVIAKNEDWPNGCEENRQFWDATPAGELTLRFSSPAAVDLEPGPYFYIDLVEAEGEGTWKLWRVARTEHVQEVHFGLSWNTHRLRLSNGEFQMTTGNKDAWKHFQSKQGSSWSVTLTEVAADHEGCPYTG